MLDTRRSCAFLGVNDMDAAAAEYGFQTSYQCPVCGASLPYHPVFLPADEPCAECREHLWCWKREHNGVVILQPLPERTPTPADVERVVTALQSGKVACIGIDLSELDTVTSAFVARLMVLHKRTRDAGGRLFLFGLNPIVRESLHHLRLDRFFEIVEHEDDPDWLGSVATMH